MPATKKKTTKKKTSAVAKKVREVIETDLAPDDPPVCDWLSTGSTLLDYAIANHCPGGIPMGRISEVYAPPSAGKSVIGMTLAGEMQRRGGIVFYKDIESTFDFQWAKLYGLDCENKDTFRLVSGEEAPLTIEEFFDEDIKDILKIAEGNPKKKKAADSRPKLVVLDTLAALSSKAERESEGLGEGYGMSRAKIISEAYRVYPPAITGKANLTILILNQLRDKVGGTGFGPKTTVPGGWAGKFMGSVRIKLVHYGKIKNSKKVVVGVSIKAVVEKNKVGPPFREARFPIVFDYGLDDITSMVEFLHEYQEGNKKGMVSFDGKENQPSTIVKYVENNNKEAKLRKETWKLWQEVHKPVKRKARKWS